MAGGGGGAAAGLFPAAFAAGAVAAARSFTQNGALFGRDLAAGVGIVITLAAMFGSVYKVTAPRIIGQSNTVCDQGEWDEMERERPGYHRLVQANIGSEVAEKLETALPTIKSRMRDGLIRMRDCLGVEVGLAGGR